MEYLKASTFEPNIDSQYPRLCGINNESYVKHCLAFNGHSLEYQTMYEYELIKHPETGEPALCIDKLDYLDSFFHNKLTSFETMESEGW